MGPRKTFCKRWFQRDFAQKRYPQKNLTIGHFLTAPFYGPSPAPLGRLGATDLSGAGRYVRSSA